MAKDTQIRFVSPKAWERVEQWSRRKPIFALMGEFSAGKSTLMNFLLRKHALPTQVTATQLPPVWFSWGDKPAYVQAHDGSKTPISLDQLNQVGINDAQFVRIYLQADILEAVDLIDTPGISDPKIEADVWRRAVGQANGVLWCTHSTQAWRETERATWASLPERLHHNSLLLVTRADALDQKDRQKVLRRVNREAGHLFNRTILFSARDAIIARDKTGDAETWARSGGSKMIDSFLEITENIMDNRAEMLARYQIDKSLSGTPPVTPLHPASDARSDDPAPLKLTDPLDREDGFEAVRNADEVIATFPVRPARVERRDDDQARARINADEAERLRAEMTADAEPVDDLRALFSDSEDTGLGIATDAAAGSDLQDFELEDEFELDEETRLEADSEDAPDTLLQDAPEQTPSNPSQADAPDTIEASVSSITALLSEQADTAAYEPEPETNALEGARVVAMPNEAIEPEPESTLEHLVRAPSDGPLSAAAMWREVTTSEDLPQDPEVLTEVFKAFLQEFDQIAREHSARQNGALNRSGKRAEWHVS